MFLPFPAHEEMSHTRGFQNAEARGFSLVEVTIALGLVTFGLVSILGVLPVGLSTLREARETAAYANLLQQVEAEYASTPFVSILQSRTFYFDQEGRMLNSNLSSVRYRLEVRTAAPSYPGMPGQIGTRLKRLEIEMVRLSGGSESAPAGPAVHFALQIADSGI